MSLTNDVGAALCAIASQHGSTLSSYWVCSPSRVVGALILSSDFEGVATNRQRRFRKRGSVALRRVDHDSFVSGACRLFVGCRCTAHRCACECASPAANPGRLSAGARHATRPAKRSDVGLRPNPRREGAVAGPRAGQGDGRCRCGSDRRSQSATGTRQAGPEADTGSATQPAELAPAGHQKIKDWRPFAGLRRPAC